MRTCLVFACVLLLSGCTAENSAYDKDGGADEDLTGGMSDDGGGGGPDGGGNALTCDEIRPRVEALLKHATACKVDEDCTLAQTACGLPAACGDFYANKDWKTADLSRLLQGWSDAMCAPKTCLCPDILLYPPGCIEGVCGPKKAGAGAIGDACTSGAHCQSGTCVTAGEDRTYAEGYCTIKGCGDANRCPTGSSSRGTLGMTRICLKDCNVTGCRKGYRCCWGAGPGTGRGWCLSAA